MSNSVPNPSFQMISFLGSFPSIEKAPDLELPEFAFLGRSNVGKSSLINYLTGRKGLAKTSSTPGKTQMINLFEIENQWVIADLPGYGYARVSKKLRSKWRHMIEGYLRKREQLNTVFLLIDIRVQPMGQDLDRMRWLAEQSIPFSIIFTKADKLKPQELSSQLELYKNTIQQDFEQLPNYFITSAAHKEGAKDVIDYVEYVREMML